MLVISFCNGNHEGWNSFFTSLPLKGPTDYLETQLYVDQKMVKQLM